MFYNFYRCSTKFRANYNLFHVNEMECIMLHYEIMILIEKIIIGLICYSTQSEIREISRRNDFICATD